MDDANYRLNCFWNNYMSRERDADEKSIWLDLFLAEFLLNYQPRKIIPEKLNSNISDLIAKEFILEVHNACTLSDENDELAPLKNYLLNGRGWRCLAVLKLFPILKLSNVHELAHLLTSLFALVDYDDCLNCVKVNPYLSNGEQKNIDDIVNEKLNSIKHKLETSEHRNVKKRSNDFNRYNGKSRAYSTSSETKTKSPLTDSVKISPFPNFSFKRNNSNEDKIVTENSSLSSRKSNDFSIEQLKNDPVWEVLELNINNAEFRLLILNVLHRLCEEDSLNTDEYEDVIGAVIKFTLENLCAIQYRFSKPSDVSIEKIKAQLTHLLITCANGTKKCKRIIDSLSQNGTVQIFLQLLQEVASSVNKSDNNEARVRKNLDFLYSLTYCILILFFQISRQDNIGKHLNAFNKLYRQFINCASSRLLENIIKTFISTSNVDRTTSLKRVNIIVTFCGLLIVRFKSLKRRGQTHIGNGTVLDKEDTPCETNLSSHHDNVFGKPFKPIILCPTALNENCCISSTFVVLLRIVLENFDRSLTLNILRILIYCGTCCCVPVIWFLCKILKLLPQQDAQVRHFLLFFLERKFYSDVGLFKNDHCMSCIIVNKTDDQWPCLDEIKILLTNEDVEIVRLIGNHLLKSFGNLAFEVRQYLIREVLKHVFELVKKEYINDKRKSRKDSILVCLAVFGDMSAYKMFSNELDEMLTVKVIQELMLDTSFTELCCRVLETRIIHKTLHIDCGNSFTPALTESCTVELNLLLNTFDECYDDIMKLICFVDDVEANENTPANYTRVKTNNANVLFYLKTIACTLERLTVRSSVVKSFFLSHTVKNKFQKLLFLILRILSQEDVLTNVDQSRDLNEDDVRLKLTQPLLIICMCLFEDTSVIENRVKELLHAALQSGKISIKQVCDSLLSLEQVESAHRENLENWNNTASTATLLYVENQNCNENHLSDGEDDVLSWSHVESALSEISEEDDNELVSLLYSYSKSTLLYPMVCTIAIDLINALKVDQCTEEALYVLQHISTICQRNSDISDELTKQNVVSKLLNKLEASLAEELLSPEEADVQYAITHFISVLFNHRVERDDLLRFLNLLKIPRAPYDYLISTLGSVVDKAVRQVQPSFYLNFPVPPNEQSVEFDEPAEALAISMREMQKRAATTSPWALCGLALPLNMNLDWCIWLTGFSMSFWYKFVPFSRESPLIDHGDDYPCEDSEVSGMVHVISVGYDTLLLEAWIDESTSCLMMKLTRPEGNSFEILSKISFQKPLDDGAWHNIVLNVKDTMKQQKIALEVTLIIDGLYEETRHLIFIGIFVRKVRPACIMLGDTRTLLKSRGSIGNLMMFRAAILNKECCRTIRSFGPDFENVIQCSVNSLKPNFTYFMLQEHYPLPEDFSINQLTQNYEENMKKMQDNILITYTPRKAKNFYHYTQKDCSSAVSASLFNPSTPTLFKKSRNARNNQRIPQATHAVIFADLSVQKRKMLYDCIQELGGFSFMAFLFAKIIDLCQMETTQCNALKIVLKSCFTDVNLYSQFHLINGYNIISEVITSVKSRINRVAFIELTDVVFSKKNYMLTCEKDSSFMNDVFICNPQIISDVLLPNWKFWEKSDSTLMTCLFRSLHSSLLMTNVYKQLNGEQLMSVNMIEKTLDMCKEKFEDTNAENNVDLCSAILEFIKIMIGTPPSIDHVKSIVDYLYIVHPISHSFCVYSPSEFYFLFSSLSQNKSKQQRASDLSSVANNLAAEEGNGLACEEEPRKVEKSTNRLVYLRNLSKSLVDLQEKRKMIHDYLNTSNFSATKSDEEDFKEEKTTDSGITGSSNLDETTPSERCSSDSPTCFTNEEEETNFVHRYSKLNFSSTPDGITLTKHFRNGTDEDCDQYIITSGLLKIIHDTILVLPDSLINSLFRNVIDCKFFLIVANHPNPMVRNTIVKTILAWFLRCDEETTAKFVSHLKGFYHLANQLAIYPATEELVNSCISLMARCHWEALDQISEMEELPMPTLHFSAVPPLLAIFPNTIYNSDLSINVVHFFKMLINKVPQGMKKLIEHGLIESLVKTILTLIHTEDDGANIENNSILLNEMIDLFALIVSNCMQTPGVSYLQILNEIVYKCRYLEVTEEALCGPGEECVHIIHNLHSSVLQAGLDTVLSLIDMYHSQDIVKGRRSPSFLSSMTGSMSASLSSIPNSISFTSTPAKQKQLSRGEIVDRYKLIINRATEYLLFSSTSVVTDKDMKFSCHLFSTLINGVSNIVHNKPYIRIGSPWSSIYWSAKETLRTQASNLLTWMLAPVRSVHLRMYVIDVLLNEPRAKEIVSTLVFFNAETESRFTIFLWHLMYSKVCDLTQAEMDMCEDFKNALQEWDIISPQAIGQAHDRWQFEVTSALRELSVVYWSLEKAQQDAVYKAVYKMEGLSIKLSELATSISAAVVERQGKERQKHLNSMRDKYRLHVEARNKWRQIALQMTHERAPWFDSDTYPDSWELDPTEGPARVRKRLRRCKLNIRKKFFKPEYSNKSQNNENYPLAYLFENDGATQTLYTSALDGLSMDDSISFTCYAINVQPGYEVEGELLIGEKYLYFIATRIEEKNVTIDEADKFSFNVKFKDIKEIHNRRFQLKERAIELFLLNGKTALIAFDSPASRNQFISALMACSLPNRIVNDMLLSDAVDRWKKRQSSNWEYLIVLNKMAGRSYNDLMQYPIMPFILAEYANCNINLKDSSIYRNLKKPMAVQDKRKEQYFINHYNCLKNESMNSLDAASVKQQPSHYASHYSNSGTVLHFLLRLPPYTQIFLQYQDNNFDLPDRTFHSLDTTWRLTSSESTTDVKEIIPEFFYLPEFLLNLQGFNFGIRQNGEAVDDVKLPAWARGNARLFVLIHRQLLESEFVRENLPHWINLIFGYKQTGKAAVDAINVFHPATYYGFDVDAIPDQLERVAWETMVKTYGQTPRQLFRNPHPMVAQNLQADENDVPVIEGVDGLRWGNYVGSPSNPPPSIVWSKFYANLVTTLVPLITNDVFGLPEHTSLLLSYNKERPVNLVNEGVTLTGAALLSWGHDDGVIRIKERREHPHSPLIFCPPKDPITACCTAPDCAFIWIGFMSGNILVFKYSFRSESGSGVNIEPEPITLVGHTAKVNNICLSQSFGIVVSTSENGEAIIWDLNEIIYIRAIPSTNLPVNLVAVSDTLGDIATVCNVSETKSSVLRLHTINATSIKSVDVQEEITAICFSTAPEGISVNVVAVGLKNGIIKLWSTWDLSLVMDIINTSIECAIIGLMYSFDSQHLYVTVSDGNVYIWEAATSNEMIKTPKFLNLTSIINA